MASGALDAARGVFEDLLAADQMGLCLFNADGVVFAVSGSARHWAPAPGQRIDAAAMFVGLNDAIAALRNGGPPLMLHSVALAGLMEATDVSIYWSLSSSTYCAMAHSVGARLAEIVPVAQATRNKRLLEHKIAEQQARIAEQAEMLSVFVRQTPVAVAMLDAQLNIMEMSDRWKQEHGDPALAQAGVETASPLTWPAVREQLRLALDCGIPSSRMQKSTRDGRETWKRIAQAPWRNANRHVGGLIVFCEDATETMRKAASLRARVGDLHRLSEEMDNLGRAVADDLRAPLRQIEFFANFLLEGTVVAPERRGYLAEIRTSVERVDRMMSALDRYMRLGEAELRFSSFSIDDAVTGAALALGDEIQKRRVCVVMGEALGVEADLALVSRVFERLLDNAAKYAGEGASIVIDCYENDDCVLIRMTDDGPGIPAHLRRRAFNFFERLGAPASIPGEGMGLAECRKIIDLHQGAISLDPEFDGGLRVLISLPSHASRRGPAGA